MRVIAPDVGGGFGGKLNVYAEEAIALAVARRLGRPVKWTATRSEDYQARRTAVIIQDVEIAEDRDRRVLGLKVDLTSDLGAYLQLLTPAVPLLGQYVYPAIYKFGAHEFSCQVSSPPRPRRSSPRPEQRRGDRSPSSRSPAGWPPSSAWRSSGTGSRCCPSLIAACSIRRARPSLPPRRAASRAIPGVIERTRRAHQHGATAAAGHGDQAALNGAQAPRQAPLTKRPRWPPTDEPGERPVRAAGYRQHLARS